MQQIERVGVVALLFLIVTIVTVALWDDTEREPRSSRALQAGVRVEGMSTDGSVRTGRGGPVIGSAARAPGLPVNVEGDNQRAREQHATLRWRESLIPESEPVADHRGTSGGPEFGYQRDPRRPNARSAGGSAHTPPDPQESYRPVIGRDEFLPRKRKSVQVPGSAASERVPVAGVTYVVQAGDALERIAARELGDRSRVVEIVELNGLTDANRICKGQRLLLPADGRAVPEVQTRTAGQESSAHQPVPAAFRTAALYEVRAGDTIERIARRELGDPGRVREIVALNQLRGADHIVIGQRLRLPGEKAPEPGRAVRSGGSAGTRREAQVPIEYVVRAGDTLERISRRELGDDGRVEEIVSLNGLSNRNLIREGQRLLLPSDRTDTRFLLASTTRASAARGTR